MRIKLTFFFTIFCFQFFSLFAQDADYPINSRIVLSMNDSVSIIGLGDPTHQESTITKYRIDLIKKLVREKDFKIISIEGNFYELYAAHLDFLKTKNYAFYEKAMYAMLNSVEMEELYDFVYEENKAGNPIYIIGFDVSFSGSTFPTRVEEKLKNNPILTDEEKIHFIKLIEKVSNTSLRAIFRNTKKLKMELAPYLEIVSLQLKPENESDFFFLQALQNLSYYLDSSEKMTRSNARDYAMGHNVDFMKKYFGEQKIILFGSSTHLLKNPTIIQGDDDLLKTRISLGEELNIKYGQAYHFVAYTAISGTKYNAFGKPSVLPGVSEHSIEEYVEKQQNKAPVYLRPQDFIAVEPMECRFLGHAFELFDLWKVFDSLVLIDDVEPFKIKKRE